MMGGLDGVMGGGWGAFGWLWMIVPLLFWGGLIALVVWAVVKVFPSGTGRGERQEKREGSAEDVLRARFARGEIPGDEYERSLRVLKRDKSYVEGGV